MNLMTRFTDLPSWFVRQMCKNLELWTREDIKCCKQSLVGQSDEIVEDQNPARNVDSEVLAHKLSEGNENSFRNWS